MGFDWNYKILTRLFTFGGKGGDLWKMIAPNCSAEKCNKQECASYEPRFMNKSITISSKTVIVKSFAHNMRGRTRAVHKDAQVRLMNTAMS